MSGRFGHFCENPRCSFHVEHPDGHGERKFRAPDGSEGLMKRLHVVQQSPTGIPRDFYFCENCSNVLAMCFGQPKNQTPQSNVT
jgi:hypothetical protein